jgi:hypothetical protein
MIKVYYISVWKHHSFLFSLKKDREPCPYRVNSHNNQSTSLQFPIQLHKSLFAQTDLEIESWKLLSWAWSLLCYKCTRNPYSGSAVMLGGGREQILLLLCYYAQSVAKASKSPGWLWYRSNLANLDLILRLIRNPEKGERLGCVILKSSPTLRQLYWIILVGVALAICVGKTSPASLEPVNVLQCACQTLGCFILLRS